MDLYPLGIFAAECSTRRAVDQMERRRGRCQKKGFQEREYNVVVITNLSQYLYHHRAVLSHYPLGLGRSIKASARRFSTRLRQCFGALPEQSRGLGRSIAANTYRRRTWFFPKLAQCFGDLARNICAIFLGLGRSITANAGHFSSCFFPMLDRCFRAVETCLGNCLRACRSEVDWGLGSWCRIGAPVGIGFIFFILFLVFVLLI
jgi:hypothetical protein